MTNQQLFTRVSRHLLRQKQRALLAPDSCAYRTPTGLRCAIGCLIPKSRYRSEFEGFRVVSPSDSEVSTQAARAIQRAAGLQGDSQLCLAAELQDLHDEEEPAMWAKGLELIRSSWDLKPATARRKSRKKGR